MNSGVPATNREADIWARLIRAQRGELPAEAAKFLLSIAFEEDDKRRMLELADRAEAGTLTAEEEAEYDGYLHGGNFLATLQSKARQALSKRGPRDSVSA
jgi:hypothetical protein